jgi:hypothetical protein
MKTGPIIAALAAALITGSTASSQAIPAAPLSKSIQHNSSSLVVGTAHTAAIGTSAFTGVTGPSAIMDTGATAATATAPAGGESRLRAKNNS